LIGYGEIAKRLHADPKTKREGNIYWKWIENYVADDYSEAVRIGSGEHLYFIGTSGGWPQKALLERHAVLQSPSRIEELVKIFIHATRVSLPGWFQGMRVADSFEDGNWVLGYGRKPNIEGWEGITRVHMGKLVEYG
jgi:hypothetical protein